MQHEYKWLKSLGALLAATVFSGVTFATPIPINGNITFSGGAMLDTGSAGTATQVLNWVAPEVESRDGDFSSVSVGAAVSFAQPWSFNSGALSSLWTVGGFTFDLISSSIVYQGYGGVQVVGSGTVSGNSFLPSVGSWRFSTQDPPAGSSEGRSIFSFSAATGVPEGGATIAMLGIALAVMGLACYRRKAS